MQTETPVAPSEVIGLIRAFFTTLGGDCSKPEYIVFWLCLYQLAHRAFLGVPPLHVGFIALSDYGFVLGMGGA